MKREYRPIMDFLLSGIERWKDYRYLNHVDRNNTKGNISYYIKEKK